MDDFEPLDILRSSCMKRQALTLLKLLKLQILLTR